MSLFHLRSTAAALLALTVKELFPDSLLIGGGATSFGFYYDFAFPFPFQKKFLREIEERMFASVRKKEQVICKEMVPFSAKEYFLSQKEYILAERAKASLESTLTLYQIAGKMLWVEGEECVENTGLMNAIKIAKIEETERGLRIHGTAFFSKEELKEFLKEKGDWIGPSHVELREGLFDWVGDELIWFSKGQKIRSFLKDRLLQEIEKEGGEVLFRTLSLNKVSNKSLISLYKKIFESSKGVYKRKIFTEIVTVCSSEDKESLFGLLDTPIFESNFSCLFCKESLLLEEVISCLHFMTKIFKIFDLESRIALIGNVKAQNSLLENALKSFGLEFSKEKRGLEVRIEWRVLDRLGVEWPVSALYAPQKVEGGDLFAMPFSLFFSLERVIALMLESKREKFPGGWKEII